MAEETRVKEIENVQGDLSKKLDMVLEEVRDLDQKRGIVNKKENTRSLTEKQAAEEFIEHFDSCDDDKCGIHNMKDDTKKQSFMKGFMLSKKLQEKQKQ
jgi:DNA-binding transcriptional regulator WhiA